ncbi:NAD(P)-binding protein [Thozetella sp. PMI_491]|nr:NAD(P)-binding protein [Thozetella sp. PMI_491]
MTVIAVAGGTGGVGRTIVEVLQSNSNYKPIVLARKAPNASNTSGTAIAVDYSDVDAVAKVLADNNVSVIISTLRVLDAPTSASEINLVRATVKSGTANRFIASDWGVQHRETTVVYAFREATLAELRKTKLRWTRFHNGFFLDYYGPPSLKSYMTPTPFAVDVANKIAGIPGTGNEPMTFTYTFDLAKFVVAALDLPKWDETTCCYGEKITWNEFLKLAEDARGSKFKVTYDSPEKIQKGEVTELPSHVAAYSAYSKELLQGLMAHFGSCLLEGRFDIPAANALNSVFPKIQTLKVKEVLEMWRVQ